MTARELVKQIIYLNIIDGLEHVEERDNLTWSKFLEIAYGEDTYWFFDEVCYFVKKQTSKLNCNAIVTETLDAIDNGIKYSYKMLLNEVKDEVFR